MTALYATAVIVGVTGLLAWTALVVAGNATTGAARLDPERRFGGRGRAVVAGVTGFGMGGISATYAGWSWGWAAVAACAAGALLGLLGARLGPQPEER